MGMQQNVARMMREFKAQRQVSLEEFSKELEISRSTLQDYLSGKGNPSVRTLDHIARKLDVDPLILVSGTFQPTQVNIVMMLFRTTKQVVAMPAEKRHELVALIVQIAAIWEFDEWDDWAGWSS